MRATHSRSPLVRLTFFLVLACWFSVGCAPARAQDMTGLYLTWSRDPSTTMTVNWVNLYPKNTDTVFYRELGTEQWKSADAKQVALEPSALQRRYLELTKLKPDTTYEFGIGKRPEKKEEGWRFRTMPAELTRPVRFVSGGDTMHTREMFDAMNEQIGPLDPDFALIGGDLAYEDGTRVMRIVDWLESWMTLGMTKDRRLIPVVAGIGNHEVRGGYNGKAPGDAPYFFGLFTFPDKDRAYYALDFGKYLSLIVLDSGHTNPIEGKQADWLSNALADRAGQTFLFPCYHYPVYGTAKASARSKPIDNARSVTIRRNWVSQFERYGVTAVFENDHHNFKRSVPIRNHQRDDANGIVYLGDGAWGVRTRDVPKKGTAWWLAKAEPRNHVWFVDLRPDKTAKVFAIDPKGTVFDELEIPKARTTPVP